MSRELYNYKRKATTAAKDLWYGDDVLAAIDHTLNGEIADCIASDLVEGSGKSCRVKILTHIF